MDPLNLFDGSHSRLVSFETILLLIYTVLAYRICIVVYRLWFHPLAAFPGPKSNGASYFPFLYSDKLQGTFFVKVKGLHDKYGPIVRVAPNRLSVAPEIAWRDIYARRCPGQAEFGKDPDFFTNQQSIAAAERDSHRRQRRLLSHAFSDAALHAQEVYIKRYADVFIERLQGLTETGTPVDLVKWFNYITFDVIGDLALGSSFGCLEMGGYHPWVEMTFAAIKVAANLRFIKRYFFLKPFTWLVTGNQNNESRNMYRNMAGQKIEERIARGPVDERKDFVTYILRHNEPDKGLSHGEIIHNSRLIITAGTETTASAMSALTFYLTQSSRAYTRLKDENRSAFKSEDDITMRSTARLAYLAACIEEALRMYPPLAETPPRVSPGDMVGGRYVPAGTILSVYQWAAYHSEKNFADAGKFIPERWLPKDHPFYESRFETDVKAAFNPFSTGPRDCIGKNLAYTEMRMIMSRLLWNFDIELVDRCQKWNENQRVFFVWQKGPLMVKLHPVDHN